MNLLNNIPQHHLRQSITDELHARPYRSLNSPASVFFFAKYTGAGKTQDQLAFKTLQQFCVNYDIPCPSERCKHFVADLADFQFKWERHSEFTTYTAIKNHINTQLFSAKAPSEMLDFLSICEGKLLCATHLCIQNTEANISQEDILSHFKKSSTVTAKIASDEAKVWTDLRLQPDGFNHILLINEALTPMKMGRVAQRLLDINAYRHLALLTFSKAQGYAPQLADIDQKLTQLLNQMNQEQENNEENDNRLLKEIINLAAEIEEISSSLAYRFEASKAYAKLVQSRLAELNEVRESGFQTISEFINRRFLPAMSTCESIRHRIDNLSNRTIKVNNLLRTRVELGVEQQNQKLLETMNHRAHLQLRMQETVEGLSVAAISYYLIGLIGYGAKSLKSFNINVNAELVAGIAIIPTIMLVAWHIRKIRMRLQKDGKTI